MLRKMYVCSPLLCFLACMGLLLCSCQPMSSAVYATSAATATVRPTFTATVVQAAPTPVPMATVRPTFTALVQAAPTPVPDLMPTATRTLPPGTTRVEKGLMDALQDIADRLMPIGADSCELLYHTIVGDIRLIGTQEEQVSQLITITYPLTRIWNETSALENCTYSFRQTAPELFSLDPYLDRVKFVYMATVIDKYGAESMGLMLWIQINREQAEKIVWAKLSQCNIPLVVEVFRLHPSLSLRQAWTDLCP